MNEDNDCYEDRVAALRPNVAKGTALLDDKVPGWYAKIDVRRLQLDDNCRCIIGQLFPERRVGMNYEGIVHGFSRGAESLLGERYAVEKQIEHGFELDRPGDEEPLKELWVGEINKRKEARHPCQGVLCEQR